MRKIARGIANNEIFISLLLIVVIAAIAYLPLINQLGYYGDDWHTAWGGYTYGPAKIADIYSTDRPFMGWVYSIAYRFLGDSPLHWHLYNYFLRAVGAVLFFWLLQILWPKQHLATTSMAALYAVYPGYLMMPNASTYQTLLFGVDLGLLSLALTVQAMLPGRNQVKIFSLLGAAITAMGTVFMFEWMIGFEGIRLILIGYNLRDRKFPNLLGRIRHIILLYLPYAFTVLVFLLWRVLIFKNTRYSTSLGVLKRVYLTNPAFMIVRLVAESIKGFVEAVLSAWVVPLYNLTISSGYARVYLAILMAALGIGAYIFTTRWLRSSQMEALSETSDTQDRAWSRHAIWIGALSVLVALFPTIAFNRSVVMGDTYDRYTLTAMAGVILLIGGAIFLTVRNPRFQVGFICLLLGLGIATHFANASAYRDINQAHNQFWWQLSWRAPDLKTATVVVPLLSQPDRFVADYDIWPELNLIYRPKLQDIQIVAQVLNRDTAKAMLYQIGDVRDLRKMVFARDYTHLLLVNAGYNSGAATCLHVIDGQQIDLSQNEDPLIALIAANSQIDQIDVNASPHQPPATFFGPEPKHTWCYYYEKASLARQKGDWAEVVRLGDQAAAQNYAPNDLVEWMPFLEGYANLGQSDKAAQIAALIQKDKNIQNSLCKRFNLGHPIPVTYTGVAAFQMISNALCRPIQWREIINSLSVSIPLSPASNLSGEGS